MIKNLDDLESLQGEKDSTTCSQVLKELENKETEIAKNKLEASQVFITQNAPKTETKTETVEDEESGPQAVDLSARKKFVIIDGNSLINRAFYALPPLRTKEGISYNAVYGFVSILAKLLLENKPEYLCVAFDAGRVTFRNEIYAEYKATRHGMPEELAQQLPVLKSLLKDMNIFIFEQKGIEADDIIGTLTKKFDDVLNVVVTGDRDSLQLVNSNTEVWLTKRGISEIQVLNNKNFKAIWGIEPSQIIDLKALMGDSSDNIPGVPGVGEKTALSLLDKYQTIDNLYQNINSVAGKLKEKLIQGEELCRMSYDLATIRCEVPIKVTQEDIKVDFPWNDKVFQFFEKLEFRSFMKRGELFVNGKSKGKNIAESIYNRIEFDNINEIIDSNKNSTQLAVGWAKNELHFAFDNVNNYVVDLLGVSVDMVLEKLKDFFVNEAVTIYVYSLKNLYYALENLKITLKAKVLDVPLAIYLVNSNIKEDKPEPMLDYLELPLNCIATGLINAWSLGEELLQERGLTKLYYDIELPLVDVLYDMEKTGITIDQNVLRNLEPKYKQEIEEIKERIFKYAGEEFNLNSPKQLSHILFDKLHFPDANNRKHSTSVEVLEELRGTPIIDEILRYRTISKLNSTYIEGLRPYIKLDGKIHTQYNQTTTVTGRLSSNEPNLQNIPVRTQEGKEIRKMFIASKDCVLLSADYSQIELRLLAHYSQDEVLIDAFKNGKDIHAITASQIFGVPLEDVTEDQRRSAKAVNFGIIYGISPFGLAQGLKISAFQAKKYIDRYFLMYPTIKNFLEQSVQEYKKNNRVTTLFGRIRNFDNIVPNTRDTRFGERAAMNMPLQGTASDIIKIAMLRVFDELKKRNLKAKLILQIHDELVLDVPKNELDEVKAIVKDKMENVVSLLVPLTVDMEVGESWYDI